MILEVSYNPSHSMACWSNSPGKSYNQFSFVSKKDQIQPLLKFLSSRPQNCSLIHYILTERMEITHSAADLLSGYCFSLRIDSWFASETYFQGIVQIRKILTATSGYLSNRDSIARKYFLEKPQKCSKLPNWDYSSNVRRYI